jgi:hypothetical protein
MFKQLLISVVMLPVLLGLLAARNRKESRSIAILLGSVFLFDVCYMLLIYYLRIRWVG